MPGPILPSVVDPLGHGVRALVEARPSAAPHLATGRYGHPLLGWRAQEALLLSRLADEIRAARLPTSTGDELAELVRSEFDVDFDASPTAAVGTLRLARTSSPAPAGVVRKGSLFARGANAAATPPRKSATYSATQDVYVAAGVLGVVLPVQATEPGAAANVVVSDAPAGVQPQETLSVTTALFDSTWSVSRAEVGGGSDGADDDDLRRMARACATGAFAPTSAAILAGALVATGVKYAAAIEDTDNAQTVVLIADASWAASQAWATRVQQALYAGYVGFGCKAVVVPVRNTFVKVTARFVLRDANDESDTAGLAASAATALRKYFDQRPDWYSFRLRAVRAALARCDPRVLSCPEAAVESAWSSAPISEPPQPVPSAATPTHFFLADNAVEIRFADIE
jgi:hypothetical protein